jgi:hypothetical protein
LILGRSSVFDMVISPVCLRYGAAIKPVCGKRKA